MSFGYDPGGRYRRRAAEKRRRTIMSLIVLGLTFYAGYWLGGENMLSTQIAYKQQAERLEAERSGLEQQITELRSEVQSTQMRYSQLEDQYKKEVPAGALKELTDMARQQLDAGIKPERLKFVISAARPPRNCTEPESKRFVVKTPVYNGPDGTVSFGNGAVTITGHGDSAVSATGQAEAWYDPGKKVKVVFTQIGGKQTVKEDLLPIQHSMVVGNKEYRFTVAAGERSFINVTGDNCDYP